MTQPALTLPYGLRDVKLTPYSAAGVLGTSVDLPAGRTLSFSEAEDFEELRGDDGLIAIRGKGPTVSFEIEGGGISLAAYAVLSGGTVTSAGTTPSQIKTYKKLSTDVRPYFKAEGQAISDIGGDFHAVIYRIRCDGDIEGELADGSFWLTKAAGTGLPDASSNLYDFIQNESVTAIT
jgi:hypothetical protein